MKRLSAPMSAREVTWGAVYMAFYFLVLPQALGAVLTLLDITTAEALLFANLTCYAVNFCVCILLFRRFLLGNLLNVGQNMGRFLGSVAVGYLCYYAAMFLVNLVYETLFPGFFNVNDMSLARMGRGHWGLLGFGIVILVPLAEECFFRGVLFAGLYSRSRVMAFGVSAVCFAAIHILSYIGSYDLTTLALCFLQYLPAGLVLAAAYACSDTIFAPILIHSAVNATALILMR